MKTTILACAILSCSLPAMAQQKSLSCDRNSFNQNKLVTTCEMREQNAAYGGRLSVDPGQNGGVTVKAWDGSGVLVRSKVEAAGIDEGAAKIVASQINVNTSGGAVNVNGTGHR